MDKKNADSANHTEPITQELIAETARERFDIPSLFPYQQLVITNILEANRALAVIDENAGITDRDDTTDNECSIVDHDTSMTSGPDSLSAETPEHISYSLEQPPEPYIAPAKQIVILPTGLGKSLCFMLPALLMDGITLIIFPLLALIEDQSRRVQELGEEPAVLRGGQSSEEREQIWRRLENNGTRFILTNPEMLQQPKILERIQQLPLAHLVIDETHTVSEWGDTFRPSYLELTAIQRELKVPQVTAFTATASPRIVERLKEIIFPDDSAEELNIIKADPDRPNIRYRVLPSISKDHDLTEMTAPDSPLERPLIVFCPTRATAERTARMLALRHLDPNIRFYHAGLSKEAKKEIEEWFFGSDNGILCCTTAYGIG